MVMGSGEWTGESVEDHPDFAWYPYVAVAGNPELEVAQVSKIVGFNAGGNGAPIDGGGDEPVDVDPPTDETGNPVAINPEPIDSMISPGELAELVINQTSSFRIDANILGPNGGGDGLKFNPGDKYRIEVVSEEKGYLYLFHITPDGDLKLIFPQAGEPNLIDGGKDKRYVLPVGKDSWLTAEGTGRHDIKAIVTEKPLRLTGFTFAMQQQQQQQSGGGETPKQEPQVQQKASQPIYVYPAAHKRLRGRLFGFFRKGGEQEQEAKPPTKLGRFAQDVASFQVLPAGGAPAQQDGAQTGQSEPKPAPRQNPLPKPNR